MAKQFSVETIFALRDLVTGPVGKIQKGINAAFASMGRSGKIFSDVFSGAFGAGLALKGIDTLTNGIKNLANSLPEYAARADEIGKTAQKLGLGTEALQRYRYAAELANVDTGTLNMAFMKLGKGMGNGTLVTALEKIDKGLAGQVKDARSTDEAFRVVTNAMKEEGDIAKRTAVLMTTFGKAGNNLVSMLGDLDEQLANASKYGNIITPAMINRAQEFNDTVSRLKMMWQGFNDIIRSAIVQYITPLITRLQEWAAENRELITTKIAEFVQNAANVIQNKVVPALTWLWEKLPGIIKFVKDFGPIILGVVAAYKIFNTAATITKAVMIGMSVAAAAQAAATGTATAAQLGLNAAMKANIIGLIVTAIVAAIAGFMLLASKVGGVGNAFRVLGQTIMKWVLIPINLMLSAIGALLGAMGHLPFIGDTMKGAQEAVAGFQNKMNTLLTGSESTLLNSGPGFLADPYKEARQRELDNQAAKREITAASTDPELLDALNRIADNTAETAGNTAEAKAAKSKARGIDYSGSGRMDFYGTVLNGF